MTDRLSGCTVAFTHDMREDDVVDILHAIKMIKGVLSATPKISNSNNWIVEQRVRGDLYNKLFNVFDEGR